MSSNLFLTYLLVLCRCRSFIKFSTNYVVAAVPTSFGALCSNRICLLIHIGRCSLQGLLLPLLRDGNSRNDSSRQTVQTWQQSRYWSVGRQRFEFDALTDLLY